MEDIFKIVEALLSKAASAPRSDEALRFAQAALCAAQTRHALADLGGSLERDAER